MRKAVDILVLDADRMAMVPSGRVILENGIISYEGLSEKFIGILEEGIIGYARDGIIYPTDGLKFMETLQVEFSGSALRATAPREVIE